MFNVAYEKIGVAGSHFGTRGHAIDLFIIIAPTNSVAPSLCKPHTTLSVVGPTYPQFLDSLRRRVNARNVSFRISLRWLTYIVNSINKTKLSSNKVCKELKKNKAKESKP